MSKLIIFRYLFKRVWLTHYEDVIIPFIIRWWTLKSVCGRGLMNAYTRLLLALLLFRFGIRIMQVEDWIDSIGY